MKTTLTVFIYLLFGFSILWADMPQRAYKYDIFSQNQEFVLTSTPYTSYGRSILGYSEIFDKNQKLIYTVNQYFPRPSFLSNDGLAIVSVEYRLWTQNREEIPTLEFYYEGEKIKTYFLKDLVKDYRYLRYSSSNTWWYFDIFVDEDVLFIHTVDERMVKFSLLDGSMIHEIEFPLFEGLYDLNKRPEINEKVYWDIEYPEGYFFPDLVTGEDFKASLVEFLNMTEVEDYVEKNHYISVSVHIDAKGNGKINYMEAKVNGIEDKAFHQTIKRWIEKNKYKTDSHPFREWTYKTYFYLVDKT